MRGANVIQNDTILMGRIEATSILVPEIEKLRNRKEVTIMSSLWCGLSCAVTLHFQRIVKTQKGKNVIGVEIFKFD